jgi:hypothetical protein
MPRSFKRPQIVSASSDSSWAHTLLGVRSSRMPSCSEMGWARSEMRGPTTSRHISGSSGGRACVEKRVSPARPRMA